MYKRKLTVRKPKITVAIKPSPPVTQPITVPIWAASFNPPPPVKVALLGELDRIVTEEALDV
jgi:hypothetical protein